jgi:phospholipid/cholesterol/gamma-HCH transport system substrate-binding protein
LVRIGAVLAVAIATVVLVVLLARAEDSYQVTAELENASQLVTGNEVVIGGLGAGTITDIKLAPDGGAEVTFTVDERFAPLRRGTVATVRQGSLSSIAGRQLELTLPPANRAGEEIPDGGRLTRAETVSTVDLDQLFNTLDDETVRDFKRTVRGFAAAYEGVGGEANEGFRYANPFLSTSRRVFAELSRDEHALEQLLVDSDRLAGLLAERERDISALVGASSEALGALAAERARITRAVRGLPAFLREANTTFVNLRSALDDVDPLVEASRPVAARLGPFFAELRAASADAVPALRDLARTVRRPGAANDLAELARLQPALARAAVGSGAPDCGADPRTDYENAADQDFRQGALGEATCALRNSLPQLSHLRAYTPELVGWFDDFSKSGLTDASGALGRVATTFNAFTPSASGLVDLLSPIDPGSILKGLGIPSLDMGNHQRCPGSLERDPGDGSTPFTDGGTLNCDPTQVPTGP